MFRRLAISVALGATAMLGSATVASAQVQDPVVIGPNESFVGLVNGASSGAVIQMGCFGPSYPGEYGHPLAGQSLEVQEVGPVATPVAFGFTGAAHEIDATYAPSSTLEELVASFTSYYVKEPLPTTATFPCAGNGVIPFTPVAGGPLARPWNTTVTFEPQP